MIVYITSLGGVVEIIIIMNVFVSIVSDACYTCDAYLITDW